MTLEREHRARIERVFEELAEFEYVVLRRYEKLPDSIAGESDESPEVDLLVASNDFDEAVESLVEAGFEIKQSVMADYSSLIREGLRKPREALDMLVSAPGEVVDRLTAPVQYGKRDASTGRYTTIAKNYGFSIQLERAGLVLDVKQHLAYTSPLNGEMRRVDPRIERHMIEHRVEHGSFFAPAPADELVHLLCHCIYDY